MAGTISNHNIVTTEKAKNVSNGNNNNGKMNRSKPIQNRKPAVANSLAVSLVRTFEGEQELRSLLTERLPSVRGRERDKTFLVLGLNKVMKLVKAGDLSVLLLDAHLPDHLVRVVLLQCEGRGASVLGLKELRTLLQTCFGFKTSVIGFLDSENSPYREIVARVKEVLRRAGDQKKTSTNKFVYRESRLA